MSQFHTKRPTGIAIVVTLGAQANAILIEDLLKEGCHSVKTARFQIDTLERRFSRNRQMNNGKFLVSLREIYSSENIATVSPARKERGVDFWKDAFSVFNPQTCQLMDSFLKEIEEIPIDLHTFSKSVDWKPRKWLISVSYLYSLFRDGLKHTFESLADLLAKALLCWTAHLELLALFNNLRCRALEFEVLNTHNNNCNFPSQNHKKTVKYVSTIMANRFFQNRCWQRTEETTKQNVESFKQRQRRPKLREGFF